MSAQQAKSWFDPTGHPPAQEATSIQNVSGLPQGPIDASARKLEMRQNRLTQEAAGRCMVAVAPGEEAACST